jgi:tetratricopeptide (TPR) repeat protein
MRRFLLLGVPLLCACPRAAPEAVSVSPDAGTNVVAAEPVATPLAGLPTPNGRLDEDDEVLAPCPNGEGALLDRAIHHYDARAFEDALACAAQAAAAEPGHAPAHAEKAAALSALGRYEEARVAFARALALAPDDADALLGAAGLYASKLAPSREYSELALAYAARGHTRATESKDPLMAAQFALIEATALNNLGRGEEAIRRADEAVGAGVDVSHARYEKGTALFELCRFEESRAELSQVLGDPDHEPWVHRFLGLIAERDGRDDEAARELLEARTLAPEDFPEEVAIDRAEFARLVASTVKALPEDMRRDVERVPVRTQDLPDLTDLTAGEVVLSPSILGLFRGPPLGETCPPDECRAIVLYRKNLVRAVRSRPELEKQVRVTLIHEIGHLRGEDDVQLAARGLE